jgi:sulfatase maturation enzyme AslB (radical SAM superfamily)
MRITNSGQYNYCRWASDPGNNSIHNIDPEKYFQTTMQPLRKALISGDTLSGCHACYNMDKHDKISGRQKQLLKVGVRIEHFEKTLASSPWAQTFVDEKFSQWPQDWQIDLGNYCNSACIFCMPEASSRLAAEWQKIGFIDKLPPSNWSDDPELIQKLINTLKKSPHIQYLHFIGGETLITPAFKTILEALIEIGLNKSATIGFTTNLSVWRQDIVELLKQFQGVNLGMSIETFDPLNDYVRWPVTISTVIENIDRWRDVAQQCSWLLQFRTTPTCLTVGKLVDVYKYALDKNIIVESCNFLNNPEVLKPSLLPMHYRKPIIDEMQAWINSNNIGGEKIINIRNPNTVQAQLVQDLTSYVNYLENEPDESHKLPELIQYIKRIEASRGNCILDYLPEYEELFRSAGY